MPLLGISRGTALGVVAILTPLSLSAPRLQTRAATVPLFPWLSVTSLSPHCHCPVSVTQPAPRGGGVGLYRPICEPWRVFLSPFGVHYTWPKARKAHTLLDLITDSIFRNC